jgi:hypothetical protein
MASQQDTFLTNSDFSRAISNFKPQTKILEAPDILHREYENGDTLRVPALSQMTSQDLNEENDETWRDITADLGRNDIPAAMVQENQGFIRN